MTTESKAMTKRDTALGIKDIPSVQKALVSRFGDRDFGQTLTVSMFIALCNKYALNPWMGHIVPYEGRPYVQHDGWLHLINREAPGQLVRLESRPANDDEYRRFKVASTDYFAIATMTRRWPGGNEITYTRRALIPKRLTVPSDKEAAAVRDRPGKAKARPLVEDPWDMAEKQARTRVMRMGFNDCLAGLATAPASPTEVQADPETGEIMEGEVIPAENGIDWSRLWASASDQDLDKAAVHARFGVGPDDGALKDYAIGRAEAEGKSAEQVVQDMADELQMPHESQGAPEADSPEAHGVDPDYEAAQADQAPLPEEAE